MSYIERDGLGFAVAAAAPIAAATGPLAPFVLGFAALASVLPMIHFGAGRKEADAIGPEQRKLGEALGQLDQILSGQTLAASDIKQLDYQLRAIWENFLNFIYSEPFTADNDTRASDQSRATMEPQVLGRLQRMADMLNAVLGRVQVPTAVQNGSGPPSLEFRNSSELNLPQAGFFQPGAVAPIGPQVIGPAPTGVDSGLLLKLAVAGGVVLLLSRR
jgi:hypothetical protein